MHTSATSWPKIGSWAGLRRCLLATVLAVGLVACGGDDDDDAQSGDTSPAPESVAPDTAGVTAAAPATSGDPPTASTEASAEPTEIRFLKSNSWDAGTASGYFTTVEEGFFEDANLIVEDIVAVGAATGIAALVSGSADVAQTSPITFVSALAGGADLVAVSNWTEGGAFGIIASPESGVTTIDQLGGKRIGILNRNSATYTSLLVQLAQAGLAEEDVEIITVGSAEAGYPALKGGDIDVLSTWKGQQVQMAADAEADGAKDWYDQATIIWNEQFLGDILVADRDFYEDNPAAVSAFVKALLKGAELHRADPAAGLENAVKHVDGLEVNEANLEASTYRSQSWVTDGRFDMEALLTALSDAFEAGIIEVDPAALDLERVFVTDEVLGS